MRIGSTDSANEPDKKKVNLTLALGGQQLLEMQFVENLKKLLEYQT